MQTRSKSCPCIDIKRSPASDDKRQDWIRSIFVDHKLYFPCRTLFNDPFDCVMPSFSGTPSTVVKRFVEDFVELKFPGAPASDKAAMISKLVSAQSLEGLQKDLQHDVDQAGILCLSKIRSDILMWAHYADGHKGLCLEFDGSANSDFFGEAQPVEYSDYSPLPLHKDSGSQMARIVLTKSTHWAYEQEYRIILPNQACTSVSFPKELLTGVIFGCLMPETLRQTVRSWAAAGNCGPAFFEARLKTDQFGLDTVRIS